MQNTHAGETADPGKHGLLQWLHDFECRVFPSRNPRLAAVQDTQLGGGNGNDRHDGHPEPAIKVYQYTFRERYPAR